MTKLEAGTYKHYKGKRYEVISTGLHTETKEKMVLYRALYDCPELEKEYGDDPIFIRPFDSFISDVGYKNKKVKRFTRL